MSATLEFDERAYLEKLSTKVKRATYLLAERVKDDGNIFIPLDTGLLRSTGRVEEDNAVTWNTEYAQRVYYPERAGITIHTEKNPNATGHWFEVAKSLKLDSWIELFKVNLE